MRQSGVQTKRDRLVVAPTKDALRRQVQSFLALPNDVELKEHFNETPSRAAVRRPWSEGLLRSYAYRPLSRQFLYDEPAYLDRPRPGLRRLAFPGQRFFMTLPKGHGAGPAIFQHTELPDLHAFQGSVGGHVFPLWLDDERTVANLASGLLPRLQEHYGGDISGDVLFDYIYGALSAPSYSLLFRDELAQGFPRIPVPAERDAFDAVVVVGRRLRAAHDLDRQVDLPRLEGRPGPLTPGRWEADRGYVSAEACLSDVPQAAWDYEVSGYRVLARWLQQRVGLDLAADLDLVDELRRVISAVKRSVALAPALDAALRAVLDGDTLGRASLLPVDPVRMAAQRAEHPEEEVTARAGLALWEEATVEALLLAEDAR